MGTPMSGKGPCAMRMLRAPMPLFEKLLGCGSMCVRKKELIAVAGIHLEMYSIPDSICPRKAQQVPAEVPQGFRSELR